MTNPIPDAKKAARAAREAEKMAEERLAKDKLQHQRRGQLETAQRATRNLEDDLRALKKDMAKHAELASHLEGFYKEIDKLTKGRIESEVTPLMLQHTNDVIRDSKVLINGDTYLDRVKEFVAAGNNPAYADVLVTLRAVQQSIERFSANLSDRETRIKKAMIRSKTITGALQLFFEGDEAPSKDDTRANIESTSVDEACFFHPQDTFEYYFDFDRLDRLDLVQYLSSTDEDESDEDEEEAETQGE